MFINPTLIDRNNEENLASWLHSNWRWQLFVTIRTPQSASADALRKQINADLIRPLGKFARTMILGVGTLVYDPCKHVHLLLYSSEIDLSGYCTHDENGRPVQDNLVLFEILREKRRDPLRIGKDDLHIKCYRDLGAAKYFAENLCRDPRGLNKIWTFGQRLLKKDRGGATLPLKDMFFRDVVVPTAA